MRDGDAIFMQYVLTGFWTDTSMGAAICFSEQAGFDRSDSRFSKILDDVYYKMSTRVWLASFYEPVSTMMLDGKPIDKCFKKWVVTKAVRAGRIKRPNQSYLNKAMQSTHMATQEFRRGWRAKHDWNTCK